MKIDKNEFNEKYMDDEYFIDSCYDIAGVVSHSFYSVDIQDYIQLAVLRAYNKRHLYSSDKGKAFSYFYKIIHNEFRYQLREYLRKTNGAQSINLLDKLTDEEKPEDWIKINNVWFSATELAIMRREEGSRHKFLKRIRRIINE